MKYVFSLFAICLCFLSTTAQDTPKLTVEYGSLFKNDKREIPIDIIGKDEFGYYMLYSEGRFGQGDELNIRKFHLDLTPSGMEINLKSKQYAGKFNSLGLRKIKNRIIHIFYVLTKTGKTYYYQTVDLDQFVLSEEKEILNIEHGDKDASESVSRFIISEDESTIKLIYTLPNDDEDNTTFQLKTFDVFFNEQSSTTYEFPYANEVFVLRNIFTSESDDIFFISKKFDSDKIGREAMDFGYEYLFHKIEGDSLKLITTIRPRDVHLRYLYPTIADNNLLLTGIYSETDLYAMSGIFTAKINLETSEVAYTNYNKLSAAFFAQLLEDGKKKDRLVKKFNEGKRDNQNYILKSVKVMDNNELLVLAEQTRTYSYNYSITYYHENVAAMRIGNDGKLIWANKIAKNQTRGNVPIYSSFYSTKRDDKVLLFYNGNADNVGLRKGKPANAFNTQNMAFMCTMIGSDGSYQRQKLFTKDGLGGVTIRPGLYNWEDENTLVLFGQDVDNLKNQRFIKVKFD
ncbi:hypothetical protein DFQ05_0730 [Winogradskyella wandonensis]|uniref:Uncharacterized protein n=1 Tax=Winogradskyella wandonensis TaxID=1442586 RepID=A0A4R1KX60_9FLAO|nr:hypothetical protein [Winogradskyella wandonensis]TCK69210.1 hypothetical protein DFQ05_0730 [Winogradskyella wandonensis]